MNCSMRFLEGGELLGVVGLDQRCQFPTTSRIGVEFSSPSPYFFTTAGSVDMWTPRDSITTA